MSETETEQDPVEQMDAQVEQSQAQAEVQENENQSHEQAQVEAQEKEEPQVPLTALQKERKKRQEYEQKVRFYEELQQKQYQPAQQEADPDAQYEAVTRGELSQYEKTVMRKIEEKNWVKQNPEKYEEVNEKLEEFLKQRPNLAAAIDIASNRYEEAWVLMNALTPKQKIALNQSVNNAPRKAAPNSPGTVPKSAGMNESLDVMQMTDDEFRAWRQAKRKRT